MLTECVENEEEYSKQLRLEANVTL